MTKRTILIKRHVRTTRITEVSLTSVYDEQIELADDELEPTNVIGRKAEAVADVLGCTYEEAERIVLGFEQ